MGKFDNYNTLGIDFKATTMKRLRILNFLEAKYWAKIQNLQFIEAYEKQLNNFDEKNNKKMATDEKIY